MTGEIKSEKMGCLIFKHLDSSHMEVCCGLDVSKQSPWSEKSTDKWKKKKTTSQTETDTFIFFINSFDNRILKPQTRLCLQVNN